MKINYIYILCVIFLNIHSQNSYTLINTGTSSHISHISIKNNTIIINGWSSYLIKSLDECNTLIPLAAPGSISNFYNHSFSSLALDTMYLLSANTSWTNEKVYKSTDGGNSWIKKLDTSNKKLNFLGFFDTNEGIAICSSNKILRTKNGGNSWQSNLSPSSNPSAFRIFGDSMVCVGDSWGGFFLSKDRGNTWVSTGGFPTVNYPKDFFFLNKDTIFGISATSNDIPGTLFTRTFNEGTAWSTIGLPLYTIAKTIYFKNKNEGYIIGQEDNTGNALILKTNTLGQTWSKFTIPIQELLMDIKFLNDSIALISGTNGLLLKWDCKAAVFVGVKENPYDDITFSGFPNPVRDKLIINYKKNNELKLQLFNTLGECINFNYEITDSKIQSDLRFLSTGIYYLKVYNDLTQKVIKFIKE